jgi:hypothetical protein
MLHLFKRRALSNGFSNLPAHLKARRWMIKSKTLPNGGKSYALYYSDEPKGSPPYWAIEYDGFSSIDEAKRYVQGHGGGAIEKIEQ